MKKVLLVVAVVLGGLLGYNYFATGEITLMPSFARSAEERELGRLEAEFDRARAEFKQAGRTAAVSGLDTTADAETARRSVKSTEKELKQLRDRLESPAIVARADRLAQSIQTFYGELR